MTATSRNIEPIRKRDKITVVRDTDNRSAERNRSLSRKNARRVKVSMRAS